MLEEFDLGCEGWMWNRRSLRDVGRIRSGMVMNSITQKLVGNSCVCRPVKEKFDFMRLYVERYFIVAKVVDPSLATYNVLKELPICLSS